MCLAPALSLAHGQDLLLPLHSSSCLLRACGMVPSREGMAHIRVSHSSAPGRAALPLPRSWSWCWYPKAHLPQNPMYLNASHTAATRLHFCPSLPSTKPDEKTFFPLTLSQYVRLWPPQPPPLPVTSCLAQSLTHSWGTAAHAKVMPSPAESYWMGGCFMSSLMTIMSHHASSGLGCLPVPGSRAAGACPKCRRYCGCDKG